MKRFLLAIAIHAWRRSREDGRALRRLGRGIASVAFGCAIVLGAQGAPARAADVTFPRPGQPPIILQCGQSRYFHLGGSAASDGSNYWDVVVTPTSSNPAVATAHGSASNYRSKGTKRPGGTDGGIEITAGTVPGLNTATISYVVEDFAGHRVSIDVIVTVDCSRPRTPTGLNPGPPAVPSPPPTEYITLAFNRIPTHRATSCVGCRPIAAELNAIIDKIADEMKVSSSGYLRGPASAADDYRQYQLLLSELDSCEKRCVPGADNAAYLPPAVDKPANPVPDGDKKTDQKTDTGETSPRTDEKSPSTERHSDAESNGAGTSDAKPTGNSDHSNAKSANTGERANTKSENSSEHAARTVAHEKSEASHQVAHTTGAGHVGSKHEAGMHEGRLGGMHAGGLGGMHLGGFGVMHLGGLGRL